jgi:hypothetical protein
MPIPDKMRLWCTCALAVCVLSVASLKATTYDPVTFQELIDKAQVIFVGDVVDVHPYVDRIRGNTVVKTRVTFRVDDPIFGTKSLVEVFDFFGGEAEGVGMVIEGMPTFAVGDRRVVFAHRDGSINPIVGFTQGLLKVTRDSDGVDRVLTLDGTPLARAESIGAPRVQTLGRNASMRLSDFRGRIAGALAEAHKQ